MNWNHRLHRILYHVSTLLILMWLQVEALAQCAMCKGAAQTTGEGGEVVQQGINTGILYLLALPFLLAGAIAVLYLYHMRRHKSAAQA